MSVRISMPTAVPAEFATGFAHLATLVDALPYDVDGVAALGDPDREPVARFASILNIDGAPNYAVAHGHVGSGGMLREVLATSPRDIKMSTVPLEDEIDGRVDAFEQAAGGRVSVKDLLEKYRGSPELTHLALKYRKAALLTGNFEDPLMGGDRSGSPSHRASEFLGQISPVALIGAENSIADTSRGIRSPYVTYARHVLLFISGAFAAMRPEIDHARYAMRILKGVSDFFESQERYFEIGATYKIEALINEVMAEIVGNFPGAASEVDGMDVDSLRSEAAETWMSFIEARPEDPEMEVMFLRALNYAQIQPDYGMLERLFIAAFRRQGGTDGSFKFLMRAAWAALHNGDERREEFRMWERVAGLLDDADRYVGVFSADLDGKLTRITASLRAQAQALADRTRY